MCFVQEKSRLFNPFRKNTHTYISVVFFILVGLCFLPIFTELAHAQQQCTSTPILNGYRDYDFSGGGVTSEPTEEKPESKLWYNDGFWWGVMWEPVSDVYTIHRLDLDNQCWNNVGPNVDARARSAQDVLWDDSNQKLYVASRAKLTIQDQYSKDARLYRYSYNSSSKTHSLDSGFPVTINGSTKTRAIVITKDSNDIIWAVWTDNQKVMVNRTDGTDANWGTAFILPAQTNDLGLDSGDDTADIASILAFGGNKIGILWGNQNSNLSQDDRKYFFSFHNESDPDTTWQPKEDVLPTLIGTGPNNPVADDHINLTCALSSGPNSGAIFAALKTGLTGANNPRVVVARRNANGTWIHAVVGIASEGHTRPIMVCDTEVDSLYVFAKSDEASTQSIYMKASSLNNLSFPSGIGRAFIISETESHINNPTSTKQCVDSSTGLVILASHKADKYYMHNYMVGSNSAPVAVADTDVTHEDAAVDINVITNDTDSDGTVDPTTVAIVTAPGNGTTSVNSTTGEITYTPNSGFTGTETFKYTVRDDNGVSATATTVTVTVNAKPDASDDLAFTDENISIDINVLLNDSDSDGSVDPTTVTIASNASNGSTSVNSTTGLITYTPDSGFLGTDTFTYTVDDNDGGTSNAATVTVIVGNDAPVAVDDAVTTAEDVWAVIDVLANDSDLDGTLDPSTVTIVSGASNGPTSVNSTTGEITYAPIANFFGSDSFTYTVKDNEGAVSNEATVTVTVTDVNDAPAAVDDIITTDEDVAAIMDVLSNDSDVDGTLDPATVTVVTTASNGSTSVDGTTGEITYSPAANYFGTDSFTYTVDDDDGATTNTATVTVTVTDVNDLPVASDDTGSTGEDTPVVIDVLSNDSDEDGTLDPATVTIVTGPSNGSTSVDGTTGAITYTPDTNFFGTDSLTYTVADNDGGNSNTAKLIVTVFSDNDAPVAGNDTTTTNADVPVVIDVLSNDSDVDGTIDPTTVTIVNDVSNGSTSVDGTTGEITYTPNSGFSGLDTFTYTVNDNLGVTSNQATVSITTNDSPVAVDDNTVTIIDAAIDIDVTVNDTDSDGTIDDASVTVVSQPINGTTSVNTTTGEITYTPNSSFAGNDMFTYKVNDNNGAVSNTASVYVRVNNAPIAQDDLVNTDEDNNVNIIVTVNDSDIDGSIDLTSVTVASSPDSGTVSVNPATGVITYSPNANYFGTDTLTYTVEDDDGTPSNAATVTVIVTAVNDAPVTGMDNASTETQDAVVINVLSNDSDVDGTIDPTTVVVVSGASNGTTSVDGATGEITYTADTGYLGNDTFTYTVDDNDGATSNETTVTVNVTETYNELPVAVADADTTHKGVAVDINVTVNDSDSDGSIDVTTVVIISQPTNGTTSVNATTGIITYTPNPTYVGNEIFTYNVQDNESGFSNTASVTVKVNNPPIAQDDAATTNEDNSVIINVTANDSDTDGSLDLTTVTAVAQPVNGTISVDGTTGEITYTPTADFFGTDSLKYTIDDNDGATSDTANVIVTVADVNDAPVAVNDAANTDEEIAISIDVLTNDSDIDGTLNSTTVTVVTSPNNGTATVDGGTGEITYTPAQNFVGTDNFTYTVNDDDGDTSNAVTVFVNVGGVNDAPIATDDAATAFEETAVVINVLSNDTDVDGTIDSSSVTVVTGASNGSTSVDGTTGEITYTPATNFIGTDSFTYTVNDNGGLTSNAATVTVTVSDVNDAPVAVDDASSAVEETPVVINVTNNDTDIDGTIDVTTVAVVSQPTNGSTNVDGTTGEITYTPALNFFGTDSFTYTVNDNDGVTSNAATVTITVSNVNDAPIVSDDTAATSEETPVVIEVLANDLDTDGILDLSTVTVVIDASNGSTSVNGTTGEITYTPATSFFGTDNFTYTVDDNDGVTSNVGTVTISINAAPIAADDNGTTVEDMPMIVDVLSNDTDLDGTLDPTTVTIATQPGNGSVTVVTSGEISLSINPTDDAYVQSNRSTSNYGSLDLLRSRTSTESVLQISYLKFNVSGLFGQVISAKIRLYVFENSNQGGTIFEVSNNYKSTASPWTEGGLNFENAPDVIGTPLSSLGNIIAGETVEFDVTNAIVDNGDYSFAITSTSSDAAKYNTKETANPPELVISFLVGGSTGNIVYSPNTNFIGSDTFTYTVNDNLGISSNSATVTVTITAINDAPVAVDDVAITNEETAVTINVLVNDSDIDGTIDPATVALVTLPSNGTATVDGVTGEITYTPVINFFGTDNFTYTVDDNDGSTSNAAAVTITIGNVNDPPDALADTTATTEDTPVVIDVLTNDSDIDGTIVPSTVTVVSGPSNGTTSVDGTTGEITYTPNSNFYGTDTLTYTVDDNNGATSNAATVTVTVTEVNDAAVAVNDTATTNEDIPVAINVLSNDSDIDGTIDTSSVSIVIDPNYGTTTIDGTTGEITYIPTTNFFGTDTFTYTVNDNDGATSNAATVTVTVTSVNDLPVAVDDEATTNEETSVLINVSANDSDVDGTLNLAAVNIVTSPSNGTATVVGVTGVVIYVPALDFVGFDSFTYIVDDNNGGTSNAGTVTVRVGDINDPPNAVNDVASTSEDTSVVIDVLANDTDLEDNINPSTVTVVTSASNGSTSVNGLTGEITYTPNTNYFGIDTFTYTVSDSDAATSNVVDVTVTVTDVNDVPVAIDDNVVTNEDVSVAIDVLSNDTDVDGTLDQSSVAVVSGPSHGATSVDATTGEIMYTPQTNYPGMDLFTYTVNDDDGAISNIASVTITVSGMNDPPFAVNDTLTTNEDTPVNYNITNNDFDLDGSIDVATLSVSPAANGIVFALLNGTVTYTPNADYFGTDSFTYTVRDNDGQTSNVATVIVTINAENDPPSAIDDVAQVNKNSSVIIDVFANDNDIDGTIDSSSVVVTTAPVNGATSVNPNTGEITFTPNIDFSGTDLFTYTVKDNDGASSNQATVTVTVNNLPVAVNDSTLTDEDTPKDINVLANDHDTDGTIDPTTVTIIDLPGNGILSVNTTNGTVTYTPNINYHGLDTFTYTVKDDKGATSNVATVNVTVNNAPIAVNESVITDEDVPININVTVNDVDLDGTIDPTSVVIATDVTNGTTSVDQTTGIVTYTPAAEFIGNDNFTYTVDDNHGTTSNAATVTITINEVNDLPVAVADAATTTEETSVNINATANDSDIDGTIDVTTVAIVTAPVNGSASVDGATGEITYIPAFNFFGKDSLTYTVNDDDGATSNAATVTITVTDVNDAPVAMNDSVNADEEVQVVIDVLSNDFDIDGSFDLSSVLVINVPSNGSAVVNETTGEINYISNVDFFGTDSLTYTVSDNDGIVSNEATVTITVVDVNDAPVAVDDEGISTAEDTPIVINVLSNDLDIDSTFDPATVTVVSVPGNGTTSVDISTGEITYSPALNYFGTDSFAYTVADNDGAVSNAANVTLTVTDVNDAPIAGDDTVTTGEDTPVDIFVLLNDTDIDGSIDPSNVTVVSGPGNGSTIVDGTTGTITYTPAINFFGIDNFNYIMVDDDGALSNAATVEVIVAADNDAPVAANDSTQTNEEIPVVIEVLSNDSDLDGTLDPTTVTVFSGANNGSTFVDGTTGVITYTPNLDFSGLDTFTYTVNDNIGITSNQATVSVTVNDSPVAFADSTITTKEVAAVIDVTVNDTDSDGTVDVSSVVVANQPSNGNTSVNTTTGTITYTPNPGFAGNDFFTYKVSDNEGGESNAANVNIKVNNPPLAQDDVSVTNEDTAVEINVLTNDSDTDGSIDATTVSVITQPANGAVSVHAVTGLITYSPNSNYFGMDSFTYIVSDDNGANSNLATVSIKVNTAPGALDDVASTPEDTAVDINVLANDIDVDGTIDVTTVIVQTQPANGTTSVDATTGIITYTPDLDYQGLDSFTYRVSDDDGGTSNPGTVTVTMTGINDAPLAMNDITTTDEDTPVVIDVLSNDTDVDGNIVPSTLAIVTAPSNGATFVDGTTGRITYTPATNFFGADSFTYIVNDNDGASSNAATVTITVTSENDVPVAVNDSTFTNKDTPLIVDVLSNDSDSDGTLNPATVTVMIGASNGSTTVDGTTGAITYTPNTGFSGTDTYTYTVDDNVGAVSNQATVYITVNDTPVAVADAAVVNKGATINIDVTANDIDSDGTIDITSVVVVSQPLNGAVAVDSTTGEITYTPQSGFAGNDLFTYKVNDNDGASSNTATVSIKVNNAPLAQDDAAVTNEDAAVEINVTVNDSDIDGTIDVTTVTVISQPANGTTSVDGTTGLIIYTPESSYIGMDSFTYTIVDNDGSVSNEATVTVRVNTPPATQADVAITAEDTPVSINVTNNDFDIDGTLDLTTVQVITQPANGTAIADNITGLITYTPSLDFFGTDSFTYTVDDNDGATSNAAMVVVTLTGTNDGPFAVNDTTTTVEDTPVVISVLANDSDGDGTIDNSSVSVVSSPSNGTASVDATTGEVMYSPAQDFDGTDSFTYTVADNIGAPSNVATVVVTVTASNDAPMALNDTTTTAEETPVVISVLSNDTDIDDTIDNSSVTIASAPSNGTTSVDGTTGTVTYSPAQDFEGTDSFTYTVADNGGATSNAAEVVITVTGSNDAPVAVNDTETAVEDTPLVISVLANDSDIDGTLDNSTVLVVSAPNNGTTTVDGTTGTVTYSPAQDFDGTDSFTYTVADNLGATSNEAMVVVTVTAANDAPVALNDTASTSEETSVLISVLSNDTDIDGTLDNSSVTVASAPSNGSTAIDVVTGTVTYTPVQDFEGTDNFSYTVADDGGAVSNAATVEVTVTGVNDAPQAVDDTEVTFENTAAIIVVLSNDYDIDGTLDQASVSIVSGPSNGVTSVDPVIGTVIYTPNQGYLGPDSFTYRVSDNDAVVSNIATVSVTVNQSNLSFNAIDDVYVISSDPWGNRGSNSDLRVRLTGSAVMNTYLKFSISGLVGNVESAKIRLFTTDGSNFGGLIHSVSNNYYNTTTPWDENGLVFGNAPNNFSDPLSSLGTVNISQTAEFDVTNAITGNGTYSFAIKSTSDDAVKYSSKEGSVSPVLVIQLGTRGPSLPSIVNFSPASGPIGTEVLITGNNFSDATIVAFNGINTSSFTVDSDNQIRAIVPSGATTGLISVSNLVGTNTSANNFTVVYPPTLVSFTPTNGPISTEVTISGNNFTTVTQVVFNGLAASSFVVDTDTQIRAIVPSGATTGKLQVTNAAGFTTSIVDFTVTAIPGITSFSPASGPIGSEVTISGVNFSGSTAVSFNGVSAIGFSIDSDTQLRVNVPIGVTTGKINVTNSDGTGTSVDDFVVVSAPTITSFTPGSGPIGTEVTLTGTEYTAATDVSFNGVSTNNFTVDSNSQVRALVPSGASTGKIIVTNNAGSATSTNNFIVTNPPIISSFSPSNGPVTTEVTILGVNFIGTINVAFNGTFASVFTVDSDTQIRAKVPFGATSGPINVTNIDGTSTSNANFTVTVPSTTFSFNPVEDAYIRSSRPDNNYGNANTLRARQTASALLASFLKFDISGLNGTVTSAILRLYAIDASDDGGSIYTVSNNYSGTGTPWNENGLIFTNAPEISGSMLSSAGAVNVDEIVEFDVTGAISGNGIFSFGIKSSSSDVVRYHSNDGAVKPELVIQTTITPSNLPNIASFTPSSGATGTEVIINGSNFTGTTTVAFNSTSASIFTVDSNVQIRAEVPVGATTGPISVTNADGMATSSGSFTVLLPPSVTSFSPTSGPIGIEVTITGSSFTGTTDVLFNGTSVSLFTIDSDTQIRATVPTSASTGPVSVTNTIGTAASISNFAVTLVPGITSFTPANGPIGTVVTVTGVNFTGISDVSFDGASVLTYTEDSNNQLRATVPTGATTGKISVTNGDGTGPSVNDFIVVFPPVLTSFTPTSGPVGMAVTITGDNFSGTTDVDFNGTSATNFTVESDIQIIAEVPTGTLTGPISVSNVVGTAASVDNFNVLQLPGITSFTPSSGQVGTEVTVSGINFTGTVSVSFSGTSASLFVLDSDSQLRATVPSGATTGKISVTNGDGTGSSLTDFTVLLPPVITSFTPASGPVGTEVTITGSNLTVATDVFFNGISASTFSVDSDTQVRATAPSGATTGTITITNAAGTGTSTSDFSVTDPPSSVTFYASEDTYVRDAKPTSNYGSGRNIRLRVTSSFHNSYIKFIVAGTGGTVQSAKIRLYVEDSSNDGGSIYDVSNNYQGTSSPWDEHGLNWNNAPQISSGSPLSSNGVVSIGEFIEFDVTSAVLGDGTYSFALRNNSSDLVKYTSKEGSKSPELVVEILSSGSPNPTISSFTPASGVIGTEVTIVGNNLNGTTAVTFNGTNATIFTVDSNTQIRANVPFGATFGPISVTTAEGSATSENAFAVLTTPTITSFTPMNGPVNVEVTLTGSGFGGLTDVSFNGTSAASFIVDSDTQVRAIVPVNATNGSISVTNPLGTATSTNTFTITTILNILSFAPASGPVGTEVTITGTSFASTNDVSFNGLSASIFTVDSNTQIRVNVPAGATTGTISVTNVDGTATSANSFTVLLPPTITSFTPATGVIGTEVTISGSSFTGTTAVLFNGASASIFTADSDSQIRANVPVTAGSGVISVTNAIGTAASADNFTVLNPPGITSVTPLSGPIGSEVTITGTNFTGTSDVSINGSPASNFTVDSNTQIRVDVPAGATTGQISVTNADGTATSSDPFTVLLPPSMTSFTPTSGPIGIEVTITGSSFTGTTDVLFNGTSVSIFTIDSDTQVRATVPTGTSTGPVSITNTVGSDTSINNFAVTQVPGIISFTPSSGPIGTEVTVTGVNFTGVSDVSFDGTSALSFTVDSDTTVRMTVPSGATTAKISITNGAGTGTSGNDFTVILPPQITSFTPINGQVGIEVTITGNNFSGTNDVSFNGTPATNYTLDSNTQIRAEVPPGATTGPISVSNVAGAAASLNDFVVLYLPGITSFNPISGQVGTEVTVTGINFTGTVSVSFNGTSASLFVIDSDSQLRTTVPTGATTGKISVTNGDGTGSSLTDFTVLLPPVITSFTPASGLVGTEVTITGSSFTGATDVAFNGIAALNFWVDSDTQVRAITPAGATTGPIRVTNTAGTASSISDFSVTAPPSTLSFNPSDDAFVRSTAPTNIYEHSAELRVRLSSTTDYNSYLKFNVSGIVGQVQSAKLRLYVIDESNVGGSIYSVSNNFLGTATAWIQAELNYNNAPEIIVGAPLSSIGVVTLGQTVEFDVTIAISGNGTFSFAISSNFSNAAKYSSKEGVVIPELFITLGSGPSNAPTITSFAPSAGPLGTEVTIYGENFTGTTNVSFDGVPAASFIVDSDSQIRVNVPQGAASGPISVTNTDGSGTSTNDFYVLVPPSITSFTPSSGPVSIEVTITGSSFTGVTDVSFNGTSASIFTLDSDSQVRANVPTGASTGSISVSNAVGTATSSNDFTVTQMPGISSFTPSSGPVGLEVTITGANFLGASDVSFNGSTTSIFTVDSDNQLRASVPANAITGKISVTNGIGTGTSANDFTVVLPPTITSFTPTSGSIGTEITIAGINFVGLTDVLFNGISASNYNIDSNTQVRADAPSGVTTGLISVTNAAGSATSGEDFTVSSSSQNLTFFSTDDAFVRSSEPLRNYVHSVELRVRQSSSTKYNSYLKFNITGIVGPVQSAKLRLHVIDGSNAGGSIYSVSNNFQGTTIPWNEAELIFNNAPEITGTPLSTLGVVNLGETVEFDVTLAISVDGIFSFAISNEITDAAKYSSKDGIVQPELVIETGSVLPKHSEDLTEASNGVELEENELTLPEQIMLLPNYPNPFNAETTMEYTLPSDTKVNLSIFNVKGQLVRVLVENQQKAGFKKIVWDGKNGYGKEVSTGVYFMRLKVGDKNLSKKITLQK